MAYLIPPELRSKEPLQWYDVCYWTPSMLFQMLDNAAKNTETELGKTQTHVWSRLHEYKEKWNCVINLVEALLHGNDSTVSHLIETTPQDISNELKFLTWLYRNAHRFPVVDFWASVMGPQIAVILRNIEMSLGPALGCGHGLLCVVEITGSAKD